MRVDWPGFRLFRQKETAVKRKCECGNEIVVREGDVGATCLPCWHLVRRALNAALGIVEVVK